MDHNIGNRILDGWLEKCLSLDARRPGFLRHVLTAGPSARHAAFLVLAHRERASGSEQPIDDTLLQRLMSDKPSALIEAEFGHVPDGLIGTLNRLEEDLPPTLYRKLFDQFREGSERAKALQQISGTLRRATIRIALHVHPVGVHPTAIIALEGEARTVSVGSFNCAIALIKTVCLSASDAVLRQSMLGFSGPVDHWLKSWIRRPEKLNFVHPIPKTDKVFQACVSGAECADWGRKLRNCMGARASLTALGLTAYAVTRDAAHREAGRTAIELRRLTGGRWLLTEMVGQDNVEPSMDEMQPLLDHLASLGILRVWEPEEHVRLAAQRILETPIGMVDGFNPIRFGKPDG